jgi:ankyrin repeat protein
VVGAVSYQSKKILAVLFGVCFCSGWLASQTIFDAAKKGDIAALKAVLEANPDLINAPGEAGRSPLEEAIVAGQSEAARFLIESGANVNFRDGEGIAPLAYAAVMGNTVLAALLIERGAKVDAQDTALGGTPLHMAALQDRVDVAVLLIEKGAPLNARTKDGRTPLALAIERGKRECAKLFLAQGAAADERDEMDRTLLHRAVLASDPELVRMLLAGGADPSVKSAYGNTALDLAVEDGQTEIAGLLAAGRKVPAPKYPEITGPYLGQEPPGLSPRIFAPGVVSTERSELNSVFTPDGKEFYFTIRRASGQWTIMIMAAGEDGRWSRPRPASFSGKWSDVDLFITADGRRVYFCSNRPLRSQGGKAKDFDIWMSERTAQGWAEPVNLGAPVNSEADEFYPSLTKDGTIYFQSRRPGGQGGPDIWRVRPSEGGFAAAECLPPPVNSAGFEGDTLIAPDESYLIVSTSRDPQSPQADLYLSRRGPDGGWMPLVKIGFEVSSPKSGENCQILSPDGRYLFFTRGGDIYWVDAVVIEKTLAAEGAMSFFKIFQLGDRIAVPRIEF